MDNCLRGYNSSVLAYGQTGSGKTHTMLGAIPKDAEMPEEVRTQLNSCARYLAVLDTMLTRGQWRIHCEGICLIRLCYKSC